MKLYIYKKQNNKMKEKGKTILLTGCAGFIGMHTALALLKKGDNVIGVDNLNEYYDPSLKESRLEIIKNTGGEMFKFFKIDLEDYASLENVFKEFKITQICHLGAQAGVRYSLQKPFVYETSNILGTLNLLELCRHYQVKSFIYASSSSIYGANKKIPFSESDVTESPISLYAATKKSTELIAHSYHHLFNINCTGLRFFTVYGPYGRPDMALFSFTKNIIEGKEIELFNHGNMKRDFTYVDDVVSGIISALEKNYEWEIFNLGNSHPEDLKHFVECIENALGLRANIKLMPMQPGDVLETYADTSKAEKMLGFKPKTQLVEGVKEFVKWYREYYKV
jgi:UDP-glucuronate 4-epimerase